MLKEEGSNATFAQLSLPPLPPHCHRLGEPLLHVYMEQTVHEQETPHVYHHIPCPVNNIPYPMDTIRASSQGILSCYRYMEGVN